jgi:UDP-N-acetylglucosamine 1-carboxyvinyltransferase
MGAKGTTRIYNCAREPEICALQDYINKCGGNIRGAGTSVIEIEGGRTLRGCEFCIIPDRIEAGTYLLLGLGTGGEVELEGIGRDLIDPLIRVLEEGGFDIRCSRSSVHAKASGRERICADISTAPYPGFPTDLQPQLTAFLTRYGAGSTVTENIFEKRFGYAKQLKKMGACIEIYQKKVIIKDNNILCGTHVSAEDLRGGAALMIAGFMADGDTEISNTKYIKRGYSRLTEKINSLGGEIREDES